MIGVAQVGNQMQRHAILHNTKKFRTDPASMKALKALVNRPGAEAEFEMAKLNPDSDGAKKLYRELAPLVQASSGKIPFSAQERSQGVAKMYSMVHQFGVPSSFFTFSMVCTCAQQLSAIPFA